MVEPITGKALKTWDKNGKQFIILIMDDDLKGDDDWRDYIEVYQQIGEDK